MKKGFTLIELSIVLIIIGLLTGGAFQMLKVMQEKARTTEAKQILESAKQAVIAYAINYGHLPANQTEFNTLGLRGAGNTEIYYESDGALQICASPITALNTRDQNDENTSNVAFVLVAAGENFNVQTKRDATTNTVRFYQWNTSIDDNPIPIPRIEPYDDFHVQVTLGELQLNAGCLPLKIINPQLPVGTVNTSYTAQISSEGGAGGYTYTYIPSIVGGYTLPSNGTISHTWTTAIPPTAIDIKVTSGTATATRKYVLQIDDPNAGNTGTGGTGTSIYQQCVDTCTADHSNLTARNNCIQNQCTTP